MIDNAILRIDEAQILVKAITFSSVTTPPLATSFVIDGNMDLMNLFVKN